PVNAVTKVNAVKKRHGDRHAFGAGENASIPTAPLPSAWHLSGQVKRVPGTDDNCTLLANFRSDTGTDTRLVRVKMQAFRPLRCRVPGT
ncbi:MAG: hypothetical protein ACKOOI_09305, partial [Pirellula sp.]